MACWAPTRRDFFAIAQPAEQGLSLAAHVALDTLGRWDANERQAREGGLDAEALRQRRQEKAWPILDEFRDGLEDRLRELAPKTPTAKAIGYTLKNWEALRRDTEDGRLEIDNNRRERAIRPLASGHNPEAYLKDVLTRLPATKQKELDPLLPHHWKPARR